MNETTFLLDKKFASKLSKRISQYSFEVGILNDGPHKDPKERTIVQRLLGEELGNYAGGPVEKLGKTISNKSIKEIFIDNQERLGKDFLKAPFQKKGDEIIKFTQAFLKGIFGKVSMNRVENLLQAVVRNPILRGDYGHNKPRTADAKGFDRHLIDTAQMFKAIKAKAKRV